jgi:tetratricopeptide (TPR) repeat protein
MKSSRWRLTHWLAAAVPVLVTFVAMRVYLDHGGMPAPRPDVIRRVSGAFVAGTITKMTSIAVTVITPGGKVETIPVTEIDEIHFRDEPAALERARHDLDRGAIENAMTTLAEIDQAGHPRLEVQADLQFYRALGQSKLALIKGECITTSIASLSDFVAKWPENYHWFEATKTLGDLSARAGLYDDARRYYAELEKPPLPGFRDRARVVVGRQLMAAGRFSDAVTQFDEVLAEGERVLNHLRVAASLGKAESLALGGKPDDGIAIARQIIDRGDPEDASIMAPAYLTLGHCYGIKPDSTKDALFAYLHIDVLYSSQPAEHAAALRRIVRLWRQLGHDDRADEAEQTLKARYGRGTD